MWNLEVYSNTGMNTVNTIDKPSRLAEAEHEILPALDVLQGEELDTITVRATRDQLKNVDYAALQDTVTGDTFFYSVTDFKPTSKDTWILYVELDPLLTLEFFENGIENIKFLDGIVSRHHVKKADDIYGAYTEDDPLLIPSKELRLESVELFTDMVCEDDEDSYQIIESMYDLPASGSTTNAVDFESEAGNVLSVPKAVAAVVRTNSIMKNPEKQSVTNFITPGSLYHDYSKKEVQAGVEIIRSLGDEQGIWRAVRIPKAAVDSVTEDEYGHISHIVAAQDTENTGLKFEYAEVQNKRALYGSLNSFVVISAANGNSTTYKPEDVYDENESPSVTMVVDARPEGKPYFRFTTFKGREDNFFLNAVEGMEWANLPIAYYESSGNWMDKVHYDANVAILNRNNALQRAQNFANTISGLGGAVSGNFTNYLGSTNNRIDARNRVIATNRDPDATEFAKVHALYGQSMAKLNAYQVGISTGLSFLNHGMQAGLDRRARKLSYENNAMQELISYVGNTVVSAPDIQFARSNSMRDYRGNGCFVYRYRPDDTDVSKIDKLLTMYGYKDTKILESSDFTGRAKFNYVMAGGVTIGGSAPRWLREAAAAQIAAGVRVWHQLPDVTAYSDGSNV